jgi:hypothetical protein
VVGYLSSSEGIFCGGLSNLVDRSVLECLFCFQLFQAFTKTNRQKLNSSQFSHTPSQESRPAKANSTNFKERRRQQAQKVSPSINYRLPTALSDGVSKAFFFVPIVKAQNVRQRVIDCHRNILTKLNSEYLDNKHPPKIKNYIDNKSIKGVI